MTYSLGLKFSATYLTAARNFSPIFILMRVFTAPHVQLLQVSRNGIWLRLGFAPAPTELLGNNLVWPMEDTGSPVP